VALVEAAGSGSVRRFRGPEARAADVLELQRNLSLLEPVAVICIRQAASLPKGEQESLEAALGSSRGGPPIVFDDVAVDRRGKLFAALVASGACVEFPLPGRAGARAFTEAEARRLGVRLSREAAELLVESLGSDRLALRRALEVVALSAAEGVVDEGQVAELVPEARPHASYELQEALARRDGARAVGLLRRALEEGQEPPALVGALHAEIRRLLLAREIPRGASDSEAAARLGVPVWRAARLRQDARRFDPRELRAAAVRLADLDVAIKTGRSESAGPLLEEWVHRVCRGGATERTGRF
jgi:DNA polymerase-3 subunit delta